MRIRLLPPSTEGRTPPVDPKTVLLLIVVSALAPGSPVLPTVEALAHEIASVVHDITALLGTVLNRHDALVLIALVVGWRMARTK